MAQQHNTPSPAYYGQGPCTKYSEEYPQEYPQEYPSEYHSENGVFFFESPTGSAPMDRGQGLSNNSSASANTYASDSSSWTEVSYSNLTPDTSMSWEEVPYIKGEDNAEMINYSHGSSQGFQTPFFPPSFTESSIDPKPTPNSLGWSRNSQLLGLYKFVVGKGKDPYFELLPGHFVSYQTPPRVFLDLPARPIMDPKHPDKPAYPCQFPWDCTGKHGQQTFFTRPADLERHYKNVHGPDDQKDSYYCDYHRCERCKKPKNELSEKSKQNKPFTRKDHYRDHLRDFHKEDLGCAKMPKKKIDPKDWPAVQEAWLAERKIYSKWWRCARCLMRRYVEEDGWECPECKVSCEQDRIDGRLKRHKRRGTSAVNTMDVDEESGYQSASATTVIQGASPTTVTAGPDDEPSVYYECACRENDGWVDNGFGHWTQCPNCAQAVAPSGYPIDEYYN